MIKMRMYNIAERPRFDNEPFLVQKIVEVLNDIKKPGSSNPLYVIYITTHTGDISEQQRELKSFADVYNNATNFVVLTDAYVDMDNDFKDDHYFICDRMTTKELVEAQISKRRLGYDNIMMEQIQMLIQCGFKDINNFAKYEYKRAFILDNSLGNQVISNIYYHENQKMFMNSISNN